MIFSLLFTPVCRQATNQTVLCLPLDARIEKAADDQSLGAGFGGDHGFEHLFQSFLKSAPQSHAHTSLAALMREALTRSQLMPSTSYDCFPNTLICVFLEMKPNGKKAS